MLKQIVKYTDFNGEDASEILYFNITKTEWMSMLDLQPRLESWLEKAKADGDDNRNLTPAEILEMVEIIKYLIEKSYGIRGDDGKKFQKSTAIYDDFKSMAVYDEFVFGLFLEPQRAVDFMVAITPKDLPDVEGGVMQALQRNEEVVELPEPEDTRPPWIKEDREPTQRELANMSKEDLLAVFAKKNRASGSLAAE